MGYKIKYTSMDQFYATVNLKFSDWNKNLGEWYTKYEKLVAMDEFQGKSADTVKAYLREVHGILLGVIQQTLQVYQTKYLLYKNGYYNLDNNIYSCIPEEALREVADRMTKEISGAEDIYDSIKGSLNSISDLVFLNNPSNFYLKDAMQGVKSDITQFKSDVESYENQQMSIVNGDLQALIDVLKSTIEGYINNEARIASYKPGDVAGNINVLQLYEKVIQESKYIEEHTEEIEIAVQKQEAVFSQINEDYEAACKARADQGTATIIIGGAAVAAGVLAIVLTAGAATPIVITAGVAGTSSAVFGIGKVVEGADEIILGKNGNLEQASINPIRDTIFCGNDNAYETWGSLNLMIAGLCIPVGQAVNMAAGAGAGEIFKEAGIAVVRETAKDAVTGFGTEKFVNWAQGKYNLNITQTTLLQMGVKFGLDKGTEFVGQKIGVFPQESFADKMSYEDAKRYNEYWKNAELGIDNGHPGMSSADLKAWNLADEKLQGHIAINKVDGNELLKLRQQELLNAENFYKQESHITVNEYCISGEEHFEALKAIYGKDNVEWISRDTLTDYDRIRVKGWGDRTPSDELYLKYKKVYQNDLYFDQATGKVLWPDNNGFAEYPEEVTLQPGEKIDRYGDDWGVFTSPMGTKYEERALEPAIILKKYSIFEVVKPIKVEKGKIAPWFDQPGGGTQYILPDNIVFLLEDGFIRRIN